MRWRPAKDDSRRRLFEDGVPCLKCQRRTQLVVFSDRFRCANCRYWTLVASNCSRPLGREWLDGGEVQVKAPGIRVTEDLPVVTFLSLCGGDLDGRLRCPGCRGSTWKLRQEQARCRRCDLAVLFPGNPVDHLSPTESLLTPAEIRVLQPPDFNWKKDGRYKVYDGRVVREGIPVPNPRVELGRQIGRWVPSASTVARWRKDQDRWGNVLAAFQIDPRPRTTRGR